MASLRVLSAVDPVAELERLRTLSWNFDPEELVRATRPRWHIDDYRQPLVPEAAGPPQRHGSWEAARRVVETYDFVDPSLIRAFYDPREAHGERNMLLEVDFWGLRIYAGVRAAGIANETRLGEGHPQQFWTWSYRTLEGHFEMGQIDYQIVKSLDSGKVEFRIHAISRAAPVGQPVVRLGFLIFGRRKQLEFAHKACARMATLTSSMVTGERKLEPPGGADHGLVVSPLRTKRTAIQQTVDRLRRGNEG
jgi:uncharacterized protein DUF1990